MVKLVQFRHQVKRPCCELVFLLTVVVISFGKLISPSRNDNSTAGVSNRRYSCSHGWTGTNMQLRLMHGSLSIVCSFQSNRENTNKVY